MFAQDAVKARILKLEGDIMGLTQRLKRLRIAPSFSFNASSASIRGSFNNNNKPAPSSLGVSFQNAAPIRQAIERQLNALRSELSGLQNNISNAYIQDDLAHPEFAVAA